MPWRDHPDPYAVWVSEIMLQQTRVETVIPYFEKWMKQFPDVISLAKAKEQDVLECVGGTWLLYPRAQFAQSRENHRLGPLTGTLAS
jgi:A/G-specific adenine glycosylase